MEADLALRDFTVNAIAEPIEGGAPIDPLGGLADLAARRLRMAGPGAFADDPLRVLRLVRIAVELDLEPDGDTLRAARAHAGGLDTASRPSGCSWSCAGSSPRRRRRGASRLMSELGATAVVLPELEALRGVEQSRFHHRDVYGHTLEVLEQTIALTAAEAGDASSALSVPSELGEGAALLGEQRAPGRRAARRAARGRADARRRAALGSAAARCRQAPHARDPPSRTGA